MNALPRSRPDRDLTPARLATGHRRALALALALGLVLAAGPARAGCDPRNKPCFTATQSLVHAAGIDPDRLFAPGSTRLVDPAQAVVRLAKALAATQEEVAVDLPVHADGGLKGAAAYRQALARAQALGKALAKAGVAEDKIGYSAAMRGRDRAAVSVTLVR